MKTLFLLVFLSASLLIGGKVYADDITQKRGYVEFENLDSVYGEPKVLINLNKTMLGFVSKLNLSDPDANELIKKLEGVLVRIYDIGNDYQPAVELIEDVSRDIRAEGWLPIVSVNEDDERVRIFTKITDDIMDGLVVMVAESGEGGEAVFINIVGEIDPEQINRVTNSLNIDVDLR